MIDDSIVQGFPCPWYDFVRAAYKKPGAISKMSRIMENSDRKIDWIIDSEGELYVPSSNSKSESFRLKVRTFFKTCVTDVDFYFRDAPIEYFISKRKEKKVKERHQLFDISLT